MNSEEEIRLRVTLQYDGSRFFGWQVQPDVPTVQGEVERAVQRLTGSRRPVLGSGRTDRGVHASGQVASWTVPAKWTAASFQQSLNALLPRDIWASRVERVAPAFHPRFDAAARSYLYRLATQGRGQSPFVAPFCGGSQRAVDPAMLHPCAAQLLGTHSFVRFARSGQPERGDVCTVARAEWRPWELGYEFLITADRYLHHMVRYLVGTMMEVAEQRRPFSEFSELLAAKVGVVTSPPAPPSGLFLAHVRYPGDPAWDPELERPSAPWSQSAP